MASRTRDLRVIAAVPCPKCGAAIGQPCRNPVPHDAQRGPVDHRAQPQRTHPERRLDWQEWKRTQ